MAKTTYNARQLIEYPSRRKTRANLKLVTPPKRVARIAPTKMRPSAEVAAERIRMLIEELGEGENYAWGWKRRAYNHLGLNEQTGYLVSTKRLRRVGTVVMDQICAKIGITIAELMDEA